MAYQEDEGTEDITNSEAAYLLDSVTKKAWSWRMVFEH